MKRCAIALGLLVAACDLSIAETNVNVTPPVPDASAKDGSGSSQTPTDDAGTKPPEDAPSSSASTLYVGICVVALANRDPEQALRFYTNVTRTDSSIELDATPLKGWEKTPPEHYMTPATVSASLKRGTAVKASSAVTAEGTFSLSFGTLNLVAEANSISGRDATIESLTMAGKAGLPGKSFCARFSGQLTVPYSYEFKASENTCLFFPVIEGQATPSFAPSAFVCP